jgi:serine/threonine-protein kinase
MKIGRYEVLEEIGQGAMGTVYRARDPLIERTVAIKTVPIEQLREDGPDAEARFLREAQSAGRLSHPSIVTIYDVGETDAHAYIAMEYLPGATLRDVMDRGPMPLDLVLDTAVQMAEALAFAHENGVIHRDVKPSNVVLTGQGGRIKLTDFGIALLANADHPRNGQMLGSPRYMSPEQAMGREVDDRSDVFSLGAVLYEMLTGRYAFDGDSLPMIVYRVIHETPAAPASLRPGLPPPLAELLARMLDKQPAARPDARTLASALQALLPTAPPPPSPPPPAATAGRRRRALILVVAGALIGVGLIARERPATPPASPAPAPAAPAPAVPAAGEATPAAPATEPPPAAAADAPPSPPRRAEAPPDPYLAGLDRKQVELRLQRTELLLQYTAQHPDVVQIDRQLEQLADERRRYLRQRRN